ncbi:hypothetical protein FACS1894187_14870 [Synergistales bacterium]|nr:hypothetical protein FACS1894187_14870 [Synergistales bacterium]
MAKFLWVLAIIFNIEGGWYAGDGGTLYGITTGTLRNARSQGIVKTQNIRDLTRRDAAWIYYELFWKTSGAYRYAYPLDLVIFDAAVHAGPEKAKALLITARKNARDNGTKTIARQYVLERYKHLHELKRFNKFKWGWRRRLGIILRRVNEEDKRKFTKKQT